MRIIALSASIIALLATLTYHQHQTKTALAKERDTLKSAYQTLAQHHLRTEAAYQALSDKQLQITQHYKQAQQNINQSPASDDAPLAPILRRPLETPQSKHD